MECKFERALPATSSAIMHVRPRGVEATRSSGNASNRFTDARGKLHTQRSKFSGASAHIFPPQNLLYLPRGAGVLQVSPGTRAHTHLAVFLRTWSLPHPALSTRHCIAYKRAPHFFLSLLSAAAPKTGNTEGDV